MRSWIRLCGVFFALTGAMSLALAQSSLPECPWSGVRHNCRGEMTLPNGDKYVGDFVNGKRTGKGVQTQVGGWKYVGDFKDDVFEGHGTFTLQGGWDYVGEFRSGRFGGQGALVLPDGRKYVGEFKADNFSGKGTLTFPDGRKYVGEFKNDVYDGQGAEYLADGAVARSGYWERGVYQAAGPRPAAAAAGAVAQSAPVVRLSARALVIGNGNYTSLVKLSNTRNDANAIAAKLRSFGIEVDLVLDADRDTLVNALSDHARRAAGKDVSILFYAGHGLQLDGANYLLPVNMRATGISEEYVKVSGVALDGAVSLLPGKTRLVFLDACRDNPFAGAVVAGRGSGTVTIASNAGATGSVVVGRGLNTVGLAPVLASAGTLIAYATKDGSVAADGDGANSPYTTALLQHLGAPFDISIVLRRVRQTVLELTGRTQEPWEYGSLVGDQLVLSEMAKR